MRQTTTLALGAAGAVVALIAASPARGSHAPQEAARAVPEPRTQVLRPADDSAEDTLQDPDDAPVRPFAQPDVPLDASLDLEYDLRARLSLTDLDARESAFDDAARSAARNPDVRRALTEIADDSTDLEVAFVARLALREADRLASWGRAGAGFGRRALPQRPQDPSEALRQRIEAVFGSDPFVDEFFQHDPFFSKPLGGRSEIFGGPDPFGGVDPFEDMRRRVEEMREQMRSMRGLRSRRGTSRDEETDLRSVQSFSSSSVNVTSTPDGVRVEIVEDDGTGPKRQVYEGDSMEALLRAHPELEGKIGG